MPIINSVIKGKQPAIDALSVTPTTSAQTITAPAGTNGYNPVSVSAVTSSIDANITAGNIKSGVTILGTTGNVVELDGETTSVTPTTSQQIITPTSPHNGLTSVTVDAVTSSIDANITAGNIKSGVSILGVAGSVTELNGSTTTINPSTSEQIVSPTSPSNGFTSVTVPAVTASIDANIQAGNIKKDVEILGVVGSFEGGITPTGTKQITANGVYDVTNFASADVQVPTTAPAYYIEKTKDANNVLQGGSAFINLNGVSAIAPYALTYAYSNNDNLTGTVDLSSITNFGNYSCDNLCASSHNITGVTFSSNTITLGIYSLKNAFALCSALTGSVDLSSIKKVPEYGLYYCFAQTKITSLDLSSVYMIDNYGCNYISTQNSSLQQINLSSVKWVGDNGLYYAFNNCTNLSGNIDLSNIISVASGGLSGMMSGDTKITGLDLSNLMFLRGTSTLGSICSGCSMLSSINISKIARCDSNNGFSLAFKDTAISSLSFNGLADCSQLSDVFNNMLQGVTGCTVHFPADLETRMQSYSSVIAGFGGTNTTVLFDLPSVTTIDLSFIESVPFARAFAYFDHLTNVTSINLSKLVYITAGNNNFESAFGYDVSLTNVDLSSLKKVSATSAMALAFQYSGIQTISLPALKSVSYSAFNNMLQGVTGCTVHLPSNFVGNFNVGGTNTTVLKDLPACVTLNGANSVKYERNPKYDTATALAWRVEDTGTEEEPIIDWTAFYTNGTTDPVVGDTIYSDAACTTAVTTISTIS